MNHKQIAVDGFSACGKSTLAKGLAKELEFLYIDTGAMYRALAWFLLQNNLNLDVPPDSEILNAFNFEYAFENQNENLKLLVEDYDVSHLIRTPEISEGASKVAVHKNVREKLVSQQQELAKNYNVVMDGRDIGTVVFPNAELKLFVTASLEKRTMRRMKERHLDIHNVDLFEQNKLQLLSRDKRDTERIESPLVQAKDAVLLDNTNLSIRESLNMVKCLAKTRFTNF